jgi:hypothetical protein
VGGDKDAPGTNAPDQRAPDTDHGGPQPSTRPARPIGSGEV